MRRQFWRIVGRGYFLLLLAPIFCGGRRKDLFGTSTNVGGRWWRLFGTFWAALRRRFVYVTSCSLIWIHHSFFRHREFFPSLVCFNDALSVFGMPRGLVHSLCTLRGDYATLTLGS